MSSPFNNAIVYAQFRLKGGVRSLLIICGLTAAGLAGLMLLTTRADPASASRVLSGWVPGLLGLQAILLLLVGGSQVNHAVRKDVASGMVASHRLMPMPAMHAVCGYVVGGCSILLGVCGVVFLAGLPAQLLVGGPLQYWLLANGLLLTFAVFSWCVVVFGSLISGGFGVRGVLLLPLVGLWLGGAKLLPLLPAAGVLASPLIGPSVFDQQLVHEITWPFGVSLLAQAGLGAIFLRGAARRFRDDETPALGVSGGLALLLTWCLVTAVGTQWREAFAPTWLTPRSLTRELVAPEWVAVVALSSALLVTLPVLAASAGMRARWRQRARAGDPWLPAAQRHPAVAALSCVGIVVALLLVPAVRLDLPPASLVRLAALLAAVTLALAVLAALPTRPDAWRGTLLLVVLLGWSILPILLDAARPGNGPPFTELSAASPVAAMLALYGVVEVPSAAVDAVIVTVLLAAPLLLAWFERRRRGLPAAPAVAARPTDR